MVQYLQLMERTFIESVNSSDTKIKQENEWRIKITTASSISACQKVYEELRQQKMNFHKETFSKFVEIIIDTCCNKFRYSSALKLAEKISEIEKFELRKCQSYSLQQEKRKELCKIPADIFSAFNEKFGITEENLREKFFNHLTIHLKSINFDKTDRLMIMDELIRDSVIQIFPSNPSTLLYLHTKHTRSKPTISIIEQFVEKKLGEGHAGIVYAAIERKVFHEAKTKALKVYHDKDNSKHRSKAYKNFLKLFSKSKCPYILPIKQLSINCLLMPLCENDLDHLFDSLNSKQNFLSFDQLFYLMQNCMQGLIHIHSTGETGMCHQDIKPANIFVRGETYVIGDFDELVDEDLDNINCLLCASNCYVIFEHLLNFIKAIIKTKKNVHLTDDKGYEPQEQIDCSFHYDKTQIKRLLDLKKQMDLIAMVFTFLELITLKRTISWFQEESLFKMKIFDPQKYTWMPEAYFSLFDIPCVTVTLSATGEKAIAHAKTLYGENLIQLLFSILHPSSNCIPSSQQFFEKLQKIK